MKSRTRSGSALGVLAFLGAVAGGSTASGQDITGVPDFDQIRDGMPIGSSLPGDTACVPTSGMDALYYLAGLGRNVLPPGSSGDPNDIPQVTADILLLSKYMGALSVNSDPYTGLKQFLQIEVGVSSANGPVALADVMYTQGPSNPVSASSLQGYLNLKAGIVGYWARYGAPDSSGLLTKVGGHAMEIVGTEYTAPPDGLTVLSALRARDPATDENATGAASDPSVQSPFATNSYPVALDTQNYSGTTATLYRETGGKRRAFTGFIAIYPRLYVITHPPQPVPLPNFIIKIPPGPVDVTVPLTGALRDLAIHPARPEVLFTQEGSTGVFAADAATGAVRIFTRAVETGRRLAFGGPKCLLYVLDGPQVLAFNAAGREVASARSPVHIDEIAFDAVRGRLAAFSLGAGRIQYYTPALDPAGRDALPALEGDGRLGASINTSVGATWLLRGGSNVAVQITYDEAGAMSSREVHLATERRCRGLFVDDDGVIYTTELGIVRTYDASGGAVASPYEGTESGDRLEIARDFSNYDRRVHGTRFMTLDRTATVVPGPR